MSVVPRCDEGSLFSGRTTAEAYEHIEQIRKRRAECPLEDQRRQHRMVEVFADQLYSSDCRTLYELLQNADDNSYIVVLDKEEKQRRRSTGRLKGHPSLEFRLYRTTRELFVFNNEDGFTAAHVESICEVALSSKATTTTAEGAEGGTAQTPKAMTLPAFIGRKGIGFKSIFTICDSPVIFSNGYQFELNRRPETPQFELGWIVPRWFPTAPPPVQNYFTSSRQHGTIIYMRLRSPEVTDSVERELQRLSPDVLLFLNKLDVVKVIIDATPSTVPSGNVRVLQKAPLEATQPKSIAEGTVADNICVVELRDDNLTVGRFLLCKKQIDAPPPDEGYKRVGLHTWIGLALPLPLPTKTSTWLPKCSLFAGLPTALELSQELLPFAVNLPDLLLTANRESFKLRSRRNSFLFHEAAMLFVNIFLAFVSPEFVAGQFFGCIYRWLPVLSEPISTSDVCKAASLESHRYNFSLTSVSDAIEHNLCREALTILATREVVLTQTARFARCYDRSPTTGDSRSSSATFVTTGVYLLPPDAPMFLYERISRGGTKISGLLVQDDMVTRFRPTWLCMGVKAISIVEVMLLSTVSSPPTDHFDHWLHQLSGDEFAQLYRYLAQHTSWNEGQRQQLANVPLLCTETGLVTVGACFRADQTVFLPNPSLQQTLEASSLSTVAQAIRHVANCSFLAEKTRAALDPKTVKWLEANLRVVALSAVTFYSRLISKCAECAKRAEYATSAEFQQLLVVLTHCLTKANAAEFGGLLARLPVVVVVSDIRSPEEVFRRYVENSRVISVAPYTKGSSQSTPIVRLAVDPVVLAKRSRSRGGGDEVVVPLPVAVMARVFPKEEDRTHFIELTRDYAVLELHEVRLAAQRRQMRLLTHSGGDSPSSRRGPPSPSNASGVKEAAAAVTGTSIAIWTFLSHTAHKSSICAVPPLPRSLSWVMEARKEVELSSEQFAWCVERVVLFVSLCCYHVDRQIRDRQNRPWDPSIVRSLIPPSLMSEIENSYWLPCVLRGGPLGTEGLPSRPQRLLCRPKDAFLATQDVCEVLGELSSSTKFLVSALWHEPNNANAFPSLRFACEKMAGGPEGGGWVNLHGLWEEQWTDVQLQTLYEAFGVVTSLKGEAVIPFLVSLKHSRMPADKGQQRWHLNESEVALLCRSYGGLSNKCGLLDEFALIYFPLLPRTHNPSGGSWYSSKSFGDAVVWAQPPEYFGGVLLSVLGTCSPSVLRLVGPFLKELTDVEPNSDHYMRYWMDGCPDLVAEGQYHLIEWFLCDAVRVLARRWNSFSTRHGASHPAAQSLWHRFKVNAPIWGSHRRVFVERSGRKAPIYVDDMIIPFSPEQLQCHIAFAPSESMQKFLVEHLDIRRLSASLRIESVKFGPIAEVPQQDRLITSYVLMALSLLLENKFAMAASRNKTSREETAHEETAGVVACLAAVNECMVDSLELHYCLDDRTQVVLQPTVADAFLFDREEAPSPPKLLGSPEGMYRVTAGPAPTLLLSSTCDSHRVWTLKSARELVKMLRRRPPQGRMKSSNGAASGSGPHEYVMQQLHNFLGRTPEELCEELSMQGVYMTPNDLYTREGRRRQSSAGRRQFGAQDITPATTITVQTSSAPAQPSTDNKQLQLHSFIHRPSDSSNQQTNVNPSFATVGSRGHIAGPASSSRGALERQPLPSRLSVQAALSAAAPQTAADTPTAFAETVALTEADCKARERCVLGAASGPIGLSAAGSRGGSMRRSGSAREEKNEEKGNSDGEVFSEPPIEDAHVAVGRWGEELAFRQLVPRWVMAELRKKGADSLRVHTDTERLDSGICLIYGKVADGHDEAVSEICWVNKMEELGEAVDVTVRGAITADIEVKATTTNRWVFSLSENQVLRWLSDPDKFRLMLVRDVYTDQPEFVVLRDFPSAVASRMLALR
eukprot:GHVS01020581.1.p1 GENE.GHVS01020581.1~~GHVS01020581.1.p1  ORF type:complete len:1908 (-),score=241.55 GHVS01020581.1:1460-7183(-)